MTAELAQHPDFLLIKLIPYFLRPSHTFAVYRILQLCIQGIYFMGEIFRFKNIKFKIWSNDHEPPHVHVTKAKAHAVINIETLVITKSFGFTDHELKIVQQQIFKRKIKILEKWEEIHGEN
jgi:hypothetical protein